MNDFLHVHITFLTIMDLLIYIWNYQELDTIHSFLHMQWKRMTVVCVILNDTYLKSENTFYTIAFNTENNIAYKIDLSRDYKPGDTELE